MRTSLNRRIEQVEQAHAAPAAKPTGIIIRTPDMTNEDIAQMVRGRIALGALGFVVIPDEDPLT